MGATRPDAGGRARPVAPGPGEIWPWQLPAALVPPGRLWLGISGSPESTPRQGSHHAVARCRELGIDALEMAWVHSVSMKQAGGERVRQAAADHDVRLSVHAPYYINLNSHDPQKLEASKDRIVAAGRAAAWSGARDVVLHLAYYHDDPPEQVRSLVAEGLLEARERLERMGVPGSDSDSGAGSRPAADTRADGAPTKGAVSGPEDPTRPGPGPADVILRPEVMGRRSQYGDLDEILTLCQQVPGASPCIDIAHLHARTGGYNTAREFDALWDAVGDALGAESLRDVHVHISGIEYGDLGEKRHLPFAEADLDYETFLEVMLDRGIQGLIIVESPAREDDVILLANVWRRLLVEAS